MRCPDDDVLENHVGGDLRDERRDAIEKHATTCDTCRARIDDIRENLQSIEGVRDALSARPMDAGDPVPRSIGPYRIVREIGRGGMGVVYLAEQERPQRRVALKVLQAGRSAETLRRFEREADLLARLRHPGIVPVFDAGVGPMTGDRGSGSVPYIAMEHVAGRRLDHFVREESSGAPAIVELLVRVTDAVHHAHVKGLVHRDLKPGNILVESTPEGPRPRVLDFGVARALDRSARETFRTSTGQIVGTFPYMSPEQVGGDPSSVDARSDVYALGVIGYELLAGKLPYEIERRSLAEIARVIETREPVPLRKADSSLSADIEAVFAKALAKDVERRYQSASEFALDLRRVLAGEPVTARLPGAADHVKRFVRAQPVAAASIAGLIVVLSAGVLVSGWQAVRATEAERAARREAEKAAQVAGFLEGMFEAGDPWVLRGAAITAEELMRAGRRRLDTELVDQPDVRAAVLAVVGRAYRHMGLYAESESLLTEALALRRAAHGETHDDVLTSLGDLGDVVLDRGDYALAETNYRGAHRVALSLHGETHLATARADHGLAKLFEITGAPDSLEKYAKRSAAVFRALSGERDPEYATAIAMLAGHARMEGRDADAESLYVQSLGTIREGYGENHPNTLAVVNALGIVLLRQGKLDRAADCFETAIGAMREVGGPDHPAIAPLLTNLAGIASRQGDFTRAEALYRDAIERGRSVYGDRHPEVAVTLDLLGQMFERQGSYELAEEHLREALAMRRETLDDGHSDLAVSHQHLATVLRKQGRSREAEAAQREAIRIRRPHVTDAWTAAMEIVLGEIVADQGRHEAAEAILLPALEVLRTSEHTPGGWLEDAAGRVAAFYEARGMNDRAAEVDALTEAAEATDIP